MKKITITLFFDKDEEGYYQKIKDAKGRDQELHNSLFDFLLYKTHFSYTESRAAIEAIRENKLCDATFYLNQAIEKRAKELKENYSRAINIESFLVNMWLAGLDLKISETDGFYMWIYRQDESMWKAMEEDNQEMIPQIIEAWRAHKAAQAEADQPQLVAQEA